MRCEHRGSDLSRPLASLRQLEDPVKESRRGTSSTGMPGSIHGMRVIVVTESFHPRMDGVVRSVDMLLDHLDRHGHSALVFAAGPGPAEHGSAQVERVPGITGLVYPDLTLSPVAPFMHARFLRFQPDMVHLASPAALGVYAAAVARFVGIPTAAHYQTDIPSYAHRYGIAAARGLLERAEALFHNSCTVTYAPTEEMALELRSRGFERVRVSRRGVDAEFFRHDRPGAAAASARWPAGEGARILCVSRLAREKELEVLLETARQLPSAQFLLVGQGPLDDQLRHTAPPNLQLAGPLHGDDLGDTYAAADVFAFPSRTETFGQVVQEAMATSLPVVGMRAGGVATLVGHHRTGLLADDAEQFTRHVAVLSGDPALRTTMGEAGRAAVLPATWTAIHDRLLEDYAGLAADRKGRHGWTGHRSAS